MTTKPLSVLDNNLAVRVVRYGVGVLVEVPVMLSVCAVCNRTRHWFPAKT